jgi:hypothetical protein
MSANRVALAALALWGATALAAAAVYVNQRRAVPASPDPRAAVTLPAHASDAVLAEMRTMLGSVHEVLLALPSEDTAAVRAAAARSGTAMAVDPELERLLPEEFLRLGLRAHAGFDTLARDAGAPRDTVLARLGGITSQCVTCHAAYRIERR